MSQTVIKEVIKAVNGHIFNYVTNNGFEYLETENEHLRDALKILDGHLSISFINSDGRLIEKSENGEHFPIEISSIPPGTKRMILSNPYRGTSGGISLVLNEQGDFVTEGTIDIVYSSCGDRMSAVIKWKDLFTNGEVIDITVI